MNGGNAMKKNKIVSKLFAGAMALTLCLGTCNVALAAPDATEAKGASITKELDIAEGIQTPEVTFSFNFVQVTEGTYSAKGDDEGKVELPVATAKAPIENVDLKFTNADSSTDGKIVKESKNFLAGVKFPNAGVYKYTVTEVQGATEVNNGTGVGKMTYDTTTYNLFVSVKNGANGTEVDSVVVEKDSDTGNEDNKVEGAPSTSEEVNSTIEGDDTNTSDNATGNDFRFINKYTKNGGGIVDPVDPDPNQPDPDKAQSALKISKEVKGDLADLTLGFTFNVKLDIPASADVTSAEGFIYNADGTYVSNKTFENGDNEFTLAHGQYLTFKKLPAGTQYTVTETGTKNYTGVTSTTVGGGEAIEVAGTKNETVSTAQSLVSENAGNGTIVTNTYDDQSATPTGILVNNLPYIALILVAVIGCVAIMAGKKRRVN